ncbi:MAG: GIY-YIG nuclease family protein, partial [Bacteroidales bacterium]|nr:GIY-YIG nuclease family protein [Bacteroidales bacterium]MBN2817855.1 GIY-YIG nuclease family protein [Bacteroidales bacterium]
MVFFIKEYFPRIASVYIIYSKKINSYYIGSCKDLAVRLTEHKQKKYKSSFTAKADDWILFLKIDDLEYQQARNIERHIKKMKSKKYIENLLRYPEMTD